MTRYIELEYFQELMKLYKARDSFHDWSSEWEKYDRKIKNTIAWLERNARTADDIREGK